MNFPRRSFLKAAATSSFAVMGGPSSSMLENQIPSSFPGGVIDIQWRKIGIEPPLVRYGLLSPLVLDHGEFWRCIIGLSLDTVPGRYLIYIKQGNDESKPFSLPFDVYDKHYPIEITKSPNPIYIQKPKEFSELTASNTIPPSFPFIPPIDCLWRDHFGRYFVENENASENQRQNALVLKRNEFTNSEIKPVVAPENGIVRKLTSSHLLNRTTPSAKLMIIDHGHGVFSFLNGLVDITVDEGNGIVKGAVLGKIKPAKQSINEQTKPTANKQLQNVLSNYSNSDQDQVISNPIIFSWQCTLNQAFINPLILTSVH